MKGTEKQITWAENIQKTALDTLQRNIDRMKAANVKSYERTIDRKSTRLNSSHP